MMIFLLKIMITLSRALNWKTSKTYSNIKFCKEGKTIIVVDKRLKSLKQTASICCSELDKGLDDKLTAALQHLKEQLFAKTGDGLDEWRSIYFNYIEESR